MNAVLRGPYGSTVLGSNVVTVGSAPNNQVVINDPKVSPRQAEIRPTGQGYTITDLGSSYGTFVDGQRLEMNIPRLLVAGNNIRFGDTTFTYEVPVYQAQEVPPYQAPYPPPSTAYGAQPDYAPPPPAYDPYSPASSAAYPPYNPTQPSYNPYTPTPPPPTYGTPPPMPAQPGVAGLTPSGGPKPQRPSRGRTIVLIALAVLVILAGAGLFFVIRNNQVAATNANATAAAQSSSSTATARANLTAQANATATFVTNPYPPHSGSLVLFDPLKDNSKGHRWDEGTTGGGRCQFAGGAYHVIENSKNTFYPCYANATNFTNFAFQVEMTLIKGDCAGLMFRTDSANNKFYYFEICHDGTYDLVRFSGNSGVYIVNHTTNAAIHSDFNQANVIAVVANGTTMTVFVNATQVDSQTDSTFSQGAIGLLADDYSNPTEAAFANAKVWGQ